MLGFKSSCWLYRNRGRRWDYYKRVKRKKKGKDMYVRYVLLNKVFIFFD